MNTFQSLPEMFVDRVAADGEQDAIFIFSDGKFQPHSWNRLADDVGRTAASLIDLGVSSGDRVALVSENRYEWIVVDLAIQAALAVHVPIHSTLSGTQIAEQIADSNSKVVLFSDSQQIEKLSQAGRDYFDNEQSATFHFISFDACKNKLFGKSVTTLAELIKSIDSSRGKKTLQDAASKITLNDLATILYTSGTTGQPKGVMLSQGNLVSNTSSVIEAFGMGSEDRRLNFLPFSHIFARTCDLYTWIACGSTLALSRNRETIIEDCQLVQPTILNGVPYFFEKVARAAESAEDEDRLRQLFGGKISICCSGGAALADHTANYYREHGITLVQGYGLSETSPVISLSTRAMNKTGTVGKTIADVEVKIAADGEILTRGPHIMQGYWKRPEETAAVMKDGWFCTGDLGDLDEEDYLKITGRKKEIIVTSLGKNVAPVYLESLLTADPLIEQAVVIGNARKYLTALIVPNAEQLRAKIKDLKLWVFSRKGAVTHRKVQKLYEDCINRRLSEVADYEKIGKFTILPRGFTIENGELTPTLKLRRAEIEKNCAAEIQAMY